jgi:hypothetical protein
MLLRRDVARTRGLTRAHEAESAGADRFDFIPRQLEDERRERVSGVERHHSRLADGVRDAACPISTG